MLGFELLIWAFTVCLDVDCVVPMVTMIGVWNISLLRFIDVLWFCSILFYYCERFDVGWFLLGFSVV